MRFLDKPVLFLATGCFVGYVPVAPGTFGSAVAIPLCYLLTGWPLRVGAPAVGLFIVVAIWVAGRAESLLGSTDPGCIVIDEIAGMLVTFLAVPLTPAAALTGFLLFRGFDIIKPFPIRRVEARLSGGAGIVLDDVVAGAFANVVLRFLLLIFQPGA